MLEDPHNSLPEGLAQNQILTPRQVDILKLVAVGVTHKGLQRQLGINDKNVIDDELSTIYTRLGVEHQYIHAINKAVALGIFTYSELIPSYSISEKDGVLSPTEFDLLQALSKGMLLVEVEDDTQLNKRHTLKRVKAKLGAASITHAAVIFGAAQEQGIPLQKEIDMQDNIDVLVLKANGDTEQTIAAKIRRSTTVVKKRLEQLRIATLKRLQTVTNEQLQTVTNVSLFDVLKFCLENGEIDPQQIISEQQITRIQMLSERHRAVIDEYIQGKSNVESDSISSDEPRRRNNSVNNDFDDIIKQLQVTNRFQACAIFITFDYLRKQMEKKMQVVRKGKFGEFGVLIRYQGREYFLAGTVEDIRESWPLSFGIESDEEGSVLEDLLYPPAGKPESSEDTLRIRLGRRGKEFIEAEIFVLRNIQQNDEEQRYSDRAEEILARFAQRYRYIS